MTSEKKLEAHDTVAEILADKLFKILDFSHSGGSFHKLLLV